MNIPETEITYNGLSLVDIGRVFWWRGRLFRAISKDSASAIQAMFDSGLVARLIDDGLLIKSWLTSFCVQGYALIIEHEVVPVPSYPREWSFSMLRDAAALVLRLNDTARSFGYQTKDCNGYNVLFVANRPVYVDLGSFVRVQSRDDVLLSYEEFLRSYYYPLHIWRSAGSYLGGRVVPRAFGLLLGQEAYLRYRWPLLRYVYDRPLIAASRALNSLRTLQHNDFEKLRRRFSPLLVRALSATKRMNLFCGPARIGRLSRRIATLSHVRGVTTWSSYHDAFDPGQDLAPTSRFDAVADKVLSLDAKSVLEIAGNAGVVSRLIRRRSSEIQVVCTDPDVSAIDKGYCASRDASDGVEWAILNPFAYESSPLETPPEIRFRSDAVIALALTHHLVLSQRFRIEYVLDIIGSYAKKYVLVEFMPLGLYNGTEAPDVPEWYDEAWFSTAFSARFNLICTAKLEPNRILFVGAKVASG